MLLFGLGYCSEWHKRTVLALLLCPVLTQLSVLCEPELHRVEYTTHSTFVTLHQVLEQVLQMPHPSVPTMNAEQRLEHCATKDPSKIIVRTYRWEVRRGWITPSKRLGFAEMPSHWMWLGLRSSLSVSCLSCLPHYWQESNQSCC